MSVSSRRSQDVRTRSLTDRVGACGALGPSPILGGCTKRWVGGTVTRWFRKPILARDNKFDSCTHRTIKQKTNMASKNNQQMSVGGAVVFRDNKGKRQFLLVKTDEDGSWEIPKVTVRRGESSVRAVIRLTGEQGGITARILEEAGRYTANSVINGNSISQKYYYYLMLQKGGPGEMIGFQDYKWMEFSDALKKIESKKEKEMFKSARDVLKEWETVHKVK